jgi:hypothetical protein
MKKIGLLEFLTMVCERTNRRRKSCQHLMDKITLAGGENARRSLYQLEKDLENFR